MLADINGKLLNDFIPTGNAIKKYYKMERFSPFLDKDVRSFALGLPISSKYNLKTDQGKLILRQINNRLKIKPMKGETWFFPKPDF